MDDDVDEQLQLQDDFLAKGKAPAAKVTRIIRRNPAPEVQPPAPASTPPANSEPVAAHDETQAGSLTASIPGILGNVLERHTHLLAPDPVIAGNSSGPGPAAFPAACHRKQSKFALSRKTAQPTGSLSEQAAPPQRVAPPARPVDENPPPPYQATPPTPTATAASATAASATAASATAAAAAPGPHFPRAAAPTDPTVAEGRAISRASLQQVSSLSSQAAAAALEEVAERVTPATLAFLKARGAKRMLAERSGQAGSVVPAPAIGRGAAAPAPKPATAPATAAVAAADPASASTAPSGFSFDKAGRQPSAGSKQQSGAGSAVSTAASISGTASQAASGATTASLTAAAVAAAVGGEAGGSPAKGQPPQDVSGGAGPPGTVADPRPVARLRWSLHGEVVGLQREDERVVDEEVLKRDVLRQDEGSAPEGYTLGELLTLARSSVPSQRTASMHMLSDIMAHARPRVDALSEQGKARAQAVPIPGRVRAMLGPAVTVTWQEVWFFNVTQLVVVAHLRLALDDENPSVAAAAAGALAAVVGLSLQEQAAAEISDGAPPASCWPAVRTGYLARPHAAATWEGAPVSYENPGAVASGMVPQGGGPDDETPEDVATIDPLAGLLQMHVLQRFRFLLEVVPHRAAIQPALLCLMACATASDQAARAVVECPRMMSVLTTILRYAAAPVVRSGPTGDEPSGTNAAAGSSAGKSGVRRVPTTLGPGGGGRKGSGGAGDSSLGRDVGYTLPEVLSCLRLVRLLCQSSREVARAVCMSGALDCVPSIIIAYSPELRDLHVSTPSTPSGSAAADSRLVPALVQLEALRVWRVCSHQGLCLASVTDMYPYLVALLSPPDQPQIQDPAVPSPARTHGSSSPAADSVRWSGSCEAFLTLTALVRHAQALETAEVNGGGAGGAGGGGDEKSGRQEAVFQMISPGIAAAVAQEDALLWLQPEHLMRVAREMVSLASTALPLALERVEIRPSLGVHPALLVPTAVSCARCLSAVLDFLASYWSTLDDPAVAGAGGQIRAAVTRSGLLSPHPSAHSSSGGSGDSGSSGSRQDDNSASPPPARLDPVLSSAKDVLVAHLVASAGVGHAGLAGGKGVAAQGVTGNLLCAWFLDQACASVSFLPPGSGRSGTAAQRRPVALQDLLMRASSGAVLHALLSLATAVYPQQPPRSECWQHVRRLSLQLIDAAPRLLLAASPSPAKSLAPWQLLRMQLQQPTTHAFLLAARLYSAALLNPQQPTAVATSSGLAAGSPASVSQAAAGTAAAAAAVMEAAATEAATAMGAATGSAAILEAAAGAAVMEAAATEAAAAMEAATGSAAILEAAAGAAVMEAAATEAAAAMEPATGSAAILEAAAGAAAILEAATEAATAMEAATGAAAIMGAATGAAAILEAAAAGSAAPTLGTSVPSQGPCASAGGAHSVAAGCVATHQLMMVDGCLAVLATAMPGAEALCLRALQLALAPHNLARVFPAALRTCATLRGECPKLAAAAAATAPSHTDPWDSSSAAVVDPLAPAHPGVAATATGGQLGAAHAESEPARLQQLGSDEPPPPPVLPPSHVGPPAVPPPAPLHSSGGAVAFPWAAADMTAVSESLVASYAASWLSLLALSTPPPSHHPHTRRGSARRDGGGGGVGVGGGPGSNQNPPLPVELQQPYLECSPGSRLPLPPTWFIDEVHALPPSPPSSPMPPLSGAPSRGTPGHMVAVREEEVEGSHASSDGAVGGGGGGKEVDVGAQAVSRALLLALGLGACGSGYMGRLPTAVKLTAVLQLAYLFNAQELVAGQVGGRGHHTLGKQQGDSEGPSQWRDVAVRCPLAALTHQMVCSGETVGGCPGPAEGKGGATCGWGERLSELLATASFGDPLLAMHVGLLLLPTTNPAVQAQVWATLAHEQALHLLPRTAAVLGGAADYLDAPCTDPRVLQAFSRALLEGDLAKALSMGGGAGGGGGGGGGGSGAPPPGPDAPPHPHAPGAAAPPGSDAASSGAAGGSSSSSPSCAPRSPSPPGASPFDGSVPIAVHVAMGTLGLHVGLCGGGGVMIAGALEGDQYAGGGRRGEYAEKHAQGLLRALVHGLHPSELARLLRHGQALGGVPAEQARLLIRVCGGDVALIERAKWALQALGML
ncbi:MAG: hypothetical protein WDW36_006098 [Sanguina aurantia]